MVKTQRYFAFGGLHYYPGGGARDFQFKLDNRKKAIEKAKDEIRTNGDLRWIHIYDIKTMNIILKINYDHSNDEYEIEED